MYKEILHVYTSDNYQNNILQSIKIILKIKFKSHSQLHNEQLNINSDQISIILKSNRKLYVAKTVRHQMRINSIDHNVYS